MAKGVEFLQILEDELFGSFGHRSLELDPVLSEIGPQVRRDGENEIAVCSIILLVIAFPGGG